MITPLRRIRSIKTKFSIVIVLAVAVAAVTSQLGFRLGWPIWTRPVVAAAISLGLVQLVAHGMTRPLRAMDHAASKMADGNYDVRIATDSQDEVGRLAGSFNAMTAQLAEVDRFRRDLVANASHELRTPIAGLQAMLENLADGVTTATPETIATMQAQVARLARLVRDLLDLSRLEAGVLPLHCEWVGLDQLVQDVVGSAATMHPAFAISTAVEPPDLKVWADPERLYQVLANLLENAARYSPTAHIIARKQQSGATRIEVVDDGPGMVAGEESRVFERFYRADRTRGSTGSGLGLAICRWIVDLHGGRITAEPNQPHGCRMITILPPAP
jgi:signal transduction histidine kinase